MASAATAEEVTKRTADDGEPEGDQSKRLRTEENRQEAGCNGEFSFSENPTLKQLSDMHQKFIRERNWDQFHPPRNVLLAMMAEVGELAEIFQWKGEVKEGVPDFTEQEREHLGQELSDVFFYLTDLAYRCRVDLPKAALNKLHTNAKKYPVSKAYGSSKKYTEYQ